MEDQIRVLTDEEVKNLKSKKKHSVKHSKDNALETNEKEALLRAIKSLDCKPKTKYRYEVLVHLMMNAGLRVSEALQVRYEWFKETEDGMVLNVPDKDRDLSNMKRDWKPKTLAGKREVFFLDNGVGEKVRSYFIENKGLDFSRQRAYQIMKKLGSMIDKPDLHPHALRSTYANMLVYGGVTESTLCYYMGWNNLQTAVNYVKTSNVAARKDLLKKFRGEFNS
jgi:site-specific recombinase XerD